MYELKCSCGSEYNSETKKRIISSAIEHQQGSIKGNWSSSRATTKKVETICLELTILKKKWCILFAYRPPNTDKEEFLMKFQFTLIKY